MDGFAWRPCDYGQGGKCRFTNLECAAAREPCFGLKAAFIAGMVRAVHHSTQISDVPGLIEGLKQERPVGSEKVIQEVIEHMTGGKYARLANSNTE